ncbi:antitermination protein [Yersinia bercovieri]|uniref:antitermination protein Q n=1 Tax=Yersinia bercovieri TaxID=634 RepID=UPI0011A4F781|nr:antitermination protein [Yersinia bercovieri]MDN0105237.1 antitermination protein [Yersinia bercovieri]
MSLESASKYFFCKTQSFTDSPRCTGDTLTGTDHMGAFGMCQSRAELGIKAFWGKLGLSQDDVKRAIQLLTQYGMKHCDKVAALRKLDTKIKVKVVQKLATFAYKDYCRSASGVEECPRCKGKRFISGAKNVIKHPGCGDKTPAKTKVEVVDEICTHCNGKGHLSVACRDCRGRRVAVDQKETERQGVPVLRDCKRCNGLGYERIPAADAFRAICAFTDLISAATWDKTIKPFYDSLIHQLDIEESNAERVLKEVTK